MSAADFLNHALHAKHIMIYLDGAILLVQENVQRNISVKLLPIEILCLPWMKCIPIQNMKYKRRD